MDFSTLISTNGLSQFSQDPNWRIIDCRFWLEDPEKGRIDYNKSHIPGAAYAHLNKDLSGLLIDGKTGRHPLPEIDDFVGKLGSWGIDNNSQVVVYDDRGGMIATRLWWMLKWVGHKAAAVLDGGYTKWVKEGNPKTPDFPLIKPVEFIPEVNHNLVVTDQEILDNFGNPGNLVVDSRASERYRGEFEPIDKIAGRIPGAVNYFWKDNLDKEDCFELKDILRGRFDTLFSGVPTENVTFYCGSGVTSAHNVLAAKHAGLGMSKVYIGSWSHWITNQDRPVLTGE